MIEKHALTTNGVSLSFLFMVIMFVLIIAGCQSDSIQSAWTDVSMKTDGKIIDWNSIPFTYYEKEDVAVGIANDSERVYLAIKFRNPRWARSIRMAGLKIWLNANGDKNRDFGLAYNGFPQSVDFTAPRGDRNMQKAVINRSPVTLHLFDKESIFKEAVIPEDGSEGPMVACDTSLSFFVYEFSVPLTASENRFYGLGVETGQNIAVGFEWGNAKPPERGNPSMRGGGGGLSGGGGRRGGGKGGQGGNMRRDQPMNQKQEVWLNVRLADISRE